MIEWFLAMMASNTVAQGVFAGMIASAPLAIVMWVLRDLPKKIGNIVYLQISKSVTFLSTMEDYEHLVHYIEQHVKWSRTKTVMQNDSVTLGYGSHWGKYNGVWFKLRKELEDTDSYNFKERCTITFYELKERSVVSYVEEAVKSRKKKGRRVFRNLDYDWELVGPLPPRPLSTVYFDGKYELINHLTKFNSSELEYTNRGIPYHTGILLYGEPGSGKTSLIKAIANEIDRDLFVLDPKNLGKGGYSQFLCGTGWEDRILVIEDIDVSGAETDRKGDGNTTLSQLLNALDGIFTPHGIITIATTNRIETLDKAITRPGRFDKLVRMDKLTEEEARQMAHNFETPLINYTPMTGAELCNKMIEG